MNKILFLTNQYLPTPGATGLCVHAIAKVLMSRGFDVHVVCFQDGGDKRGDYVIDGINVHKIPIPFYLKDYSNRRFMMQTISRIFSLTSKLYHLHQYPLRSSQVVNNIFREASSLISLNDSATVIATYTPLEACACLLKLKRFYPNIKTCFYSTDTLSNEKGNSAILSENKRRMCGLRWEFRLLDVVDKAIIMECHQDHYFSEVFKSYHNKMEIANFPLLKREYDVNKQDYHSKRKRLVYAGTLYKYLRNPSFICQLLEEIGKHIEIESIFMGGGDCMDIMDTFTRNSDVIKYLGMQPHTVATETLANADVLLSIGNAESPMAPSKIYEYMSTGKPIIHTYTWDFDPCLQPLKKYGNALLIKEGGKLDMESIINFVNTSRTITYDDVVLNFNTATPEYSADIIERI